MSVVSLLSPRAERDQGMWSVLNPCLLKDCEVTLFTGYVAVFRWDVFREVHGTPGDDRIRCQVLEGLTTVNVPTGHVGGVPEVDISVPAAPDP